MPTQATLQTPALQEHLALLRRLALALPESFPDLAILSDDSDDKDFFSNVAHLQLHRRTRALGRLVKARDIFICDLV
jgi:U3 small nucleolar RNA-associated protein 20